MRILTLTWVTALLATNSALATSSDPGPLPERVYIKTPTQTFNLHNYYALRDGKIWIKPNEETTGKSSPWKLMDYDGLPGRKSPFVRFARPNRILELTADADQLMVISNENRIYMKNTRSKSWLSDSHWHDGWGFPEAPLFENELTRGHRAFTLGRRSQYVLYSEDPDGNQHNIGIMGTSTLYIVPKDGKKILFTDSGLTQDFSHSICGPQRGTVEMENLSASASTLFTISRFGEMFTKMEDYDLNGGTAMFFNYTYRREKRPHESGKDKSTTLTKWSLPLEDWKRQPHIYLKGKARLSRDITILQNGQGNAARELRVAGQDERGRLGYYSKLIFDSDWKFIPADLTISEDRYLNSDEVNHPELAIQIQNEDIHYRGQIQFGDRTLDVELLNFNLSCTPSTLRIHLGQNRIFDLTLHSIEIWTPLKRYAPGFDGTPKIMYGTLEYPNKYSGNPTEIDFLFADLNLEPFKLLIQANTDQIEIKPLGNFGKKDQSFVIIAKSDQLKKFPSLKGLVQKDTFTFLNQADYEALIHGDSLEITHPEKLTAADIPTLENKVRWLKELRGIIKSAYSLQKKNMHMSDRLAPLLQTVGKWVYQLGGKHIRIVDTMSLRMGTMFRVYSDAAKPLLKESKAAYKAADEKLRQKIQEYRRSINLLKEVDRAAK